jgi:hypothetical protein
MQCEQTLSKLLVYSTSQVLRYLRHLASRFSIVFSVSLFLQMQQAIKIIDARVKSLCCTYRDVVSIWLGPCESERRVLLVE